MKREKIFNWISVSTLVLTVVFIFAIISMLLCPYNIVETNSPFPVYKEEVKAGGEITYDVQYCKFKDVSGNVKTQLVNDVIHFYPDTFAIMPAGCKNYTGRKKLPDFLSEGEYKLMFNVEYKVNPLKTISIPMETETFRVIK